MNKKPNKLSATLKVLLFVALMVCAQTVFSQKDAARAEKLVKEGQDLVGADNAVALVKLKEARRLFKLLKDLRGEGKALFFIGFINERAEKRAEALQLYQEVLQLFDKYVTAPPKKTETPKKRLENLREVIYISTLTYQNIGSIYSFLGNQAKTLENLGKATSLAKDFEFFDVELNILGKIADVYQDSGEIIKAIDYLQKSLEVALKTNDRLNGVRLLNRIGKLYNDLQENQKALEYFLTALVLWRELKNREGEGQTLSNLGKVYVDLGENQKALEYLLEALLIRREFGDKYGEALTLNNLGMAYFNLGDYPKALEYYHQSVLLFKQTGDQISEATAVSNIGLVYEKLKDFPKALEFYNRALAARRKLKDKAGEAISLNNLGTISRQLGETQKAVAYFEQAIALAREIEDRKNEAVVLTNLGTIYAENGDSREAVQNYYLALSQFKAIDDKINEASTLSNLMAVWNRSESPQISILFGKLAVNKYQALRKSIQGLDQAKQQTYLKKIEQTYRFLADVLIKAGRLPEAYQILTSFKDQQFFDFDQTQLKAIDQIPLTPREIKFIEGYQKISQEIESSGQQLNELKKLAKGRQMTEAEKAQAEKLEQIILKSSIDLVVFLGNGEGDFTDNAANDKVSDIPELRQFQKTLADLSAQTKQKTVAVYQLVGEENFHALIVTPDAIKKVSTSIKNTEINEKALKLWALLQTPAYDTTVLSKKIYNAIFKPLEAELPKDTTTIMWALDDNLRYLPMAALWDGKQFLAERFNHVIFTRADAERMTKNLNPNWTGTGFGSTQAQKVQLLGDEISFSALPGVEAELKEIFKQTDSPTGILTGEVLPDAKFTKSNFIESLKQKRPIVHIASHFSFRAGDETRSFLLMGDGTALTLNEMKQEANLFQEVDLLTLSACNTAALQSNASGKEIDGFAELAQRLGAGAVMATLWSVSDASTPWLMRDFYANKLNNKEMTKAEALRNAQLALLEGTAETKPFAEIENRTTDKKVEIVIIPRGETRDGTQTRSDVVYLEEDDAPPYQGEDKPKFAHPYYWSPFILIGNWK